MTEEASTPVDQEQVYALVSFLGSVFDGWPVPVVVATMETLITEIVMLHADGIDDAYRGAEGIHSDIKNLIKANFLLRQKGPSNASH